jgi:glycosyltransferase involved in cell wall biosynthesis
MEYVLSETVNKILSIVIPTYNMELYLPRCLDSILQDEVLDKIEIIIVNDGSTDDSLSIANTYKERFSHSLVVMDKPNGHYGSCVNAALEIASGTYFRILDADDRFDSVVFIKFVHFLETCDADMVFTNYSRDYLSGGAQTAVKHAAEKYIRQLLRMHAVTYRTQVLHDVGYKQLEGICYTDTEYCFYPLVAVKSRAYFDEVLYRYTIGREGQSIAGDIYYKNRDHFYTVTKRMLAYLLCNNDALSLEIRKLLYMSVAHTVYHYYLTILTHTRNEIDDIKIKEIDSMLTKIDAQLYAEIGNLKSFRILTPIKIWRNSSVYIGETRLFTALQKFFTIKNLLLKRSI